MEYETDFLLVDNDIVFTADGDIELVPGPRMVAQDIDRTLKVTPGALYWDKEAGSSMTLFLSDTRRGRGGDCGRESGPGRCESRRDRV
jgi:hypothetical protein